mgnify:CR=1 FL=1
MLNKYDEIILTHPILGNKSFAVESADALMAMPNNGGWTVAQLTSNDNSTGDKGSASEPKKRKSTRSRKAPK